jgi:predicted phage terminase large subunit-like protein
MDDNAENPEMSEADRKLWDLFVFSKRVLGYEQVTKLHMGWFKSLLESQFLLLLAPRGHFKSVAVTISYALWRLVHNPNLRILIVNETLINARNFLREIKEHALANERFRERYGAWDMAASKWTEDSVTIPRTRILKEPSISAGGVLGNLVSLHNDIVILDDPVSNKNSETPHQRQKLLNWFKNVILPALEPDGQLIVVGTRWHSEDLYGHIREDVGFNHWTQVVQSAEWNDEAGVRRVLFPERFSEKKLDELKGTMGTSSYFCQMLNDVSGQEGSDFKASWIDSGKYDLRPDNLTVYAGIDLAITKNEKGSSFAYCVIGKDKSGVLYVIDAYREQIPFVEQLMAVKRIKKHHNPSIIMIETNAYQAAFPEALRMDEETRRLPIFTKTTTGDKHARLRGLAPLFQRGDIRLPRSGGVGVNFLEAELLHFPQGSNDLLDALWIAVQALEEQRTEPRITFTDDIE